MSRQTVLFLDVDGVLNNTAFYEWAHSQTPPRIPVDPKRVAMVRRVVAKTGCKVVLSSSWRESSTHMTALKTIGVPIDDTTPILDPFNLNGVRGAEIERWIESHPDVVFAIIDDNENAGLFHPERFVQTRDAEAMTRVHERKLVDLLS